MIGKDQEVSVLFSDVRGFTSLSERLGAREPSPRLATTLELAIVAAATAVVGNFAPLIVADPVFAALVAVFAFQRGAVSRLLLRGHATGNPRSTCVPQSSIDCARSTWRPRHMAGARSRTRRCSPIVATRSPVGTVPS